MVMKALEEELLPYRDDGNSFRARSKAIWNQATLQMHQDRLNHQALAMTCLLQAVQLDTSTARLTTAREDLLHKSDPILRKSDQSAHSIVPSRMSTSTCRTSMRYVYHLGHVLGAARHVLGRIGKVIPI